MSCIIYLKFKLICPTNTPFINYRSAYVWKFLSLNLHTLFLNTTRPEELSSSPMKNTYIFSITILCSFPPIKSNPLYFPHPDNFCQANDHQKIPHSISQKPSGSSTQYKSPENSDLLLRPQPECQGNR